MNDFKLPPIRFDSAPMDAQTLAQRIDWGLREHKMPELWRRSAGAGVLVTILDTGVPRHIDLPETLFSFNFTDSRSKFDQNSHQTHCAGIVAAKNNEVGVVGWAPDCTLAHIKVLGDRGGGRSSWITKGISTATEQWMQRKSDFVGCIISMSLGGGFDARQDEAIEAANEAGILVVAAAGNRGFTSNRSTVDFPGSSPHTIGVAAYRRNNEIADFSSGGPEVDIAMPGESILSTVPGNRYQAMSGTSMATPAAAGLMACILSSRPHDSSIREVQGMREILKLNSDDRGELGKDNRFGFGVPSPADLIRDSEYWFF